VGHTRSQEHTVFPLAALTQFEVAGSPRRGMEAGVAQDDHPPINLLHQPLQGVVRNIGGGTRPPHDHPPLIEQQTEFAADNPAVIGEAFAAALLRAAALAHGVDQLDAIGVDAPEHGRSGQEGLRPVVMRREETQEPGTLGEVGKQRPIVARQPAIKGPVAHAFEGMEQPQGAHLTGPEVRLGVWGDGAQLLIDFIEQGGDKLYGHPTALLSSQGCHASQRGRVVGRLQAQKLTSLVLIDL
jgi:hypothetical protein